MHYIRHFNVEIPLFSFISDTILGAIKKGIYEYTEASQIGVLVQEGERVLEIGVGIGFIATLVLRHPNTTAYLGFEANPELVNAANELFNINKVNGEIINAVLTNDPDIKEMNFYLRKDFWASSLSEKPWGYEKTIKIKSKLFNHIIDSFKPTMIICDIEGGELDLFRDACLLGVKKVYMEIHQNVLGRRGVRKLFDIMSSKGFHYDQWHSKGSVVLFSHVDR